MPNRQKLVKQFLLLIRNIKGDEIKIVDIETVLRNGSLEGLKLEIRASEKKPRLKLIKPLDHQEE